MLSQKARYALRAMIELARENGQVTAGELAVRADAPRKFLEAILLTLSRQGLVTSRRGKFGGYLLGRDPAAITRSMHLPVSYEDPSRTRDAIAAATAAGFQHIVLGLSAPYPANVARWVADELI
jgi:hypothetical protein